MKALTALSIIFIICISWAQSASASTVVKTTLEDLASSPFVVSGEVKGSRYLSKNALGLRWKVAEFQVTEVLNKPSDFHLTSGHVIFVATLTGEDTFQDVGVVVTGAPKFSVGQKMILSLENPRGVQNGNELIQVFNVVALAHGVLHLSTSDSGEVELTRQDGTGLHSMDINRDSHRLHGRGVFKSGQGKQDDSPQKSAQKSGIISLKDFRALVESKKVQQ